MNFVKIGAVINGVYEFLPILFIFVGRFATHPDRKISYDSVQNL
jgi:hypothetical protein